MHKIPDPERGFTFSIVLILFSVAVLVAGDAGPALREACSIPCSTRCKLRSLHC